MPQKTRGFSKDFYGGQNARAAIDISDERELEKAFARNIYGVAAADPRASRLARYARAVVPSLELRSVARFRPAGVAFPARRRLRTREHRAGQPAAPWHFSIAVEDIAEAGQRFELAADAETRAAIAQMAGLRDLARLQGSFEVRQHGRGGLRVTGLVSATVGQTCVVTLEALTDEIAEEVDLLFLPTPSAVPKRGEPEALDQGWDEPEPLVGGKLDLGALATEFLILGLNPYPRKNGAVFEPPQHAKQDEGPFAALAALKKGVLDR